MFRRNPLIALVGAGILVQALGCASLGLGLLAVEEARRLWADRDRLAFDDLVLTIAMAVLTGAATWLCLAILLTVSARLRRRSTGLLATLARRITPPLCRRLLSAACGAAVLTGPVVALPAANGAAAGGAAPCRPVSCRTPQVALPAPHRPAPARGPDRSSPVIVHVGDTLWGIATEHLRGPVSGYDIATAWPRWFRVNRARLGPDPNLIHPGTRLRVPPRFDRTR